MCTSCLLMESVSVCVCLSLVNLLLYLFGVVCVYFTKTEGSRPDVGMFDCWVFRYFYLLLNTPGVQAERGTGCADASGLCATEPFPDSHTGL